MASTESGPRFASSSSDIRKAIELEEIDTDVFIARRENLHVPFGARGVFGGQVLAQALEAARFTVKHPQPSVPEEELRKHKFYPASLSCVFLKGGSSKRNMLYTVDRAHTGRGFATRVVSTRQQGQTIFTATIVFHRSSAETSPSLNFHDALPRDLAEPETLKSDEDIVREAIQAMDKGNPRRKVLEGVLKQPARIEARRVRGAPFNGSSSRTLVWMRVNGTLEDNDDHVHRTAFAWMSDAGLLASSLARYGGLSKIVPSMWVTLTHSIHFHTEKPPRADEYLLFDMRCHMARHNRAFVEAKVFTRDGRLVNTCTQEGLVRLRAEAPDSMIVPEAKMSKL